MRSEDGEKVGKKDRKVRKWEAERLSQGKDRNVRGEKKESDLSSKTNTSSGCGHLGKC